MIAVVFGCVSILLGFTILLLPLLLTELSRPRDSLLGGLFLIQGLVLYIENDLFRGSPMLVVVAGASLLGKMTIEISENRWQQLSSQEKERIGSLERWTTSFSELALAFRQIGKNIFQLNNLFQKKSKKSGTTKKWVRPEKTEVTTEGES